MRRPMGLVNVVNESLKSKPMMAVQDCLQATDGIYRTDWSELLCRFVVCGLEKASYGRHVVLATVEVYSSLKH